MAARTVIRNGFLVSMDDAVGVHPTADVVIEDGRITAVGPGAGAAAEDGDVEVIDATGCIVLPGFVDTHRHLWETALRGSMPSCTLDEYLGTVIGAFGPVYQPDDIYVGNYLVECLAFKWCYVGRLRYASCHRYLAGGSYTRGCGRRAGYDLLPLSLMIRGVLSPGLVASADR